MSSPKYTIRGNDGNWYEINNAGVMTNTGRKHEGHQSGDRLNVSTGFISHDKRGATDHY